MLTDHQLRGVRVTGAWAMPLMAFGFTVSVLPVAGFLIVIVFSAVLGLVTGGLAGGLLVGFIATMFGGAAVVQNPLFVIVPIIVGALAFWGGSWGSVRRALVQDAKKQQERYAAEWAAREREHPANHINSSEQGRPENNGGACET